MKKHFPKNAYASRSKLSESATFQILKCFAVDISATQCSHLCGVSRVTVNRYYMEIRKTISASIPLPRFSNGEFELDESYFGPRYSRGKRGRGSPNKSVVFGILNRGGDVFARVVPNASRKVLFPIIERFIPPKKTVHTDYWRSYSNLNSMGYCHKKVNHSKEYANKESHVNGIEGYWSFCKRRLSKFNGVFRSFFSLHLAECQWRFNQRKSGRNAVLKSLLSLVSQCPLFSIARKLFRSQVPETEAPKKAPPKETKLKFLASAFSAFFSFFANGKNSDKGSDCCANIACKIVGGEALHNGSV